MIISIVFLIVILTWLHVYNMYLKEYIEVTVVYKSLKKLWDTRNMLVIKILPDIENKSLYENILCLIDTQRNESKVSYDNAIIADVELHNELKNLYDIFDKMKKNEIQTEIFKRIIAIEKQLKYTRNRYTDAVGKYNIALTLHPKFLIKMLHMRPFDVYGVKEK